jgi:hypothetical protein
MQAPALRRGVHLTYEAMTSLMIALPVAAVYFLAGMLLGDRQRSSAHVIRVALLASLWYLLSDLLLSLLSSVVFLTRQGYGPQAALSMFSNGNFLLECISSSAMDLVIALTLGLGCCLLGASLGRRSAAALHRLPARDPQRLRLPRRPPQAPEPANLRLPPPGCLRGAGQRYQPCAR